MAVKVGKSYMGESPGEQLKLEKRRFEAKQKRIAKEKERLRVKLLKADDGKNQKLI